MTNKIKMTKKVLTIVLSAAILCASLFVMPLTASAKTTYGDWVSQSVLNGDFELGVEGAEPYGWSKTSLNYGINDTKGSVLGFYSEKNEEEVSVYKDIYGKEFKLTTEVEDGNRVLAVTKKGSGYIGATSAPIAVSPSTAYSVSAIFKEFADYTEYPAEPTNGYYDADTEIVIKQFTTDDTVITTDLTFTRVAAAANSDEWQTLSGAFTTASTTNYIVIYLCVGSQWKVLNTVYFDDVTIEKLGFNGDFEAGAFNWTEVSMDYNATGVLGYRNENYLNAFDTTSVVENDGNHVLSVQKKASGYIGIQSIVVPVEVGATYKVSALFKEFADATDATNGNVDFPTCLGVAQSDTSDLTSPVFSKLDTKENSAEWTTLEGTFVAAKNYAVMYLCVGSQWNVRNTIYFDDAVIEKVGLNGDFGVGTVGSAPANWTDDISMNYAGNVLNGFRDPENTWDGNFVPKTALDSDGDKVLALHKVGGGYGAIISAAVPVEPSTSYTVSAIYKHFEVTTDNNDFGAAIVVCQYAGSDSVGSTDSLGMNIVQQKTPSYEWVPLTTTFTTNANAKYIRIYLTVGSGWNHRNVVYFDDVTVTCNAPSVDYGFNGDFEAGNAGEDVASWKETSMSFTDEANSYEGSYTITNVDDNGNQVMSINKTGAGYIAAKSQAYGLRSATDYTFNFKYKYNAITSNDNGEAASGNEFYGVAVMIKEFDANGNVVKHTTYYAPNNAGGSTNYICGPNGVVTHVDQVTEYNTNWQDAEFNFTTQANTTYAHIYFWMGGGYKVKTSVWVDDVNVSCEYDRTDFTDVLFEGVNVDGNDAVDILDLVKVKVAEGAYNDSADLNKNGVVNREDALYVRAAIFGYTSYEKLCALFK